MNKTPDGGHFHIKWGKRDSLDWECFDSFRDAKIRASEMAGPDEEFTIQMVATACPLRGLKGQPRSS
jgi:hypothetical protein